MPSSTSVITYIASNNPIVPPLIPPLRLSRPSLPPLAKLAVPPRRAKIPRHRPHHLPVPMPKATIRPESVRCARAILVLAAPRLLLVPVHRSAQPPLHPPRQAPTQLPPAPRRLALSPPIMPSPSPPTLPLVQDPPDQNARSPMERFHFEISTRRLPSDGRRCPRRTWPATRPWPRRMLSDTGKK